jgi:predicted nucleotidyltransferase
LHLPRTAAAFDPILGPLIAALIGVPGVAAVALGGSRARGTAAATSDYDIGLYYREGAEPRAVHIREATRDLIDNPDLAIITEVGEWGRWIVGGAWLKVGGMKVDLLYRCIDAVRSVICDCRAGRVTMDYQPGHPHGFSSAIWMGEVALCRPLHDPERLLAGLEAMTAPYPEPLRETLVRRFQSEAQFSIENAEAALGREDETYVAGCAFRALSCVAQVLFTLNRRYLINEKGAIGEASGLPITISRLTDRASEVWRAIGRHALAEAIDGLRAVERELEIASADAPFAR